MTASELHNEILAYCRANYNGANVKKYSRYFKDGVFDSYGLTGELLHGKVKEITGRKDVDFNLLRETSFLLVKGPRYEETSFAIVFYRSVTESFSRLTFNDIALWFETGISNWGHCDVISGDLIFTLLDKEIIGYNDLESWMKAKNKYQRRAVPVSLIKLIKKTGVERKHLSFIEPLMTDPDREVHQGAGWFLREAWKLNKPVTEKFLMKWKNISPRLIYQYACEKMTAVEKQKFKREKGS